MIGDVDASAEPPPMQINDPLEDVAIDAVRSGDTSTLSRVLTERPGLASARLVGHGDRTLLHVATDWPGHFPQVRDTISVLVAAGADVNAPSLGDHRETALHWAASSDDVDALDALLDAGADIEAIGAVIGGGTALSDATAFGCWAAARLLIERGAHPQFWEAAALGLLPQLRQYLDRTDHTPQDVTHAFWCACHGNQPGAAAYLLERGADINWVGYDDLTPLGAAQRSGATTLLDWLRAHGATTTSELPQPPSSSNS
jgi:ankyrin repeat protein